MSTGPKSLLGLALLATTAGCAHFEPARCDGSQADAAAVAHTIRSFYAALAADDEAAAARLTSPNFYSFDVGKRFTGPELSAIVEQAHQRGTVLNWNIGPIDTHFDCNTAWAAWENIGSAGTAGDMKPVTWLESAMLRRRDGNWQLEFLHSTRAAPRQ